MQNLKDNDEEVPRTAPKQKNITFQSPIAPVVPEVSMIAGEKPSNFYRQWDDTGTKIPATSSSTETTLQVKSYRKSAKSNQHILKSSLKKPTTPEVLKTSNFNFPSFVYPPPTTPTQEAVLVEPKIFDSIAQQLKLYENEIFELRELVKQLSRDLIELKLFEADQHEKTRKMFIKPEVKSIDIQCKLGQEINLDDENEQNLNKTDKRFEPKLEMSQKTTGSIPKIKTVKETCDEKSTETIPKMNLLKLENDLEKYEVLSGLPRSKLDEAMEIMALTCKYVPREKLREWGFKEPGKTEVSIATLQYMEKYGLIGLIPEEKDKKTTDSSQESTNKILDSKAIKNQPKFM